MPIKVVTISDLDESQKEIVRTEPWDSSMFISGPPGSGKTSVAILRTRMLLDNGVTNVLFLLYNHSLYGYLRKVFSKMKLKNSINIETKDKFFWGIYFSIKHGYPDGKDYEEKYEKVLREVSRASESILPRYKLLVLDESQDFSKAELLILSRLTSRMVVLDDFDQQIYQETNASIFSKFPQKHLETIYRFGRAIAKIAEPFSSSGIDLQSMVTRTGNTPAYRIETDSSDAFSVLCQIVKNKTVADGTMAIISPRREGLRQLSAMLKGAGIDNFFSDSNNTDLRDYDYDSKRPLLITPHSAKGMEFDTVVMWGFSDKALYYEKNTMIYLSITRTCGELYLIQTPDTCPELQRLDGFESMEESDSDGIDDF